MEWTLLIFLLFSLLVGGPAFARQGEELSPQPVILGGGPEPLESVISKVTVRLIRNAATSCSGTLIDRDIVLTAAHCVMGREDEPTALFVQASDIESDLYQVDQIKIHPQVFRSNLLLGLKGYQLYYDLAVLKLRRPFPLGHPVAWLPVGPVTPMKDHPVLAAGYGRTHSNGTSGLLHSGWSLAQRKFSVQSKYPPQLYLSETLTCKGDSGGPVFDFAGEQVVVIGVHSSGTCSKTDPRSVAEDVLYNINWIKKVVQELKKQVSL